MATIPSSIFAVRRSCAPRAAMSHKIRESAIEVTPRAMPATMHAHIPAIEIAFGETFREASQAVVACAHFRLRVAIGRRAMCSVAGSSIVELKSIAGLENNTQMKAWERHVRLFSGMVAPVIPSGARDLTIEVLNTQISLRDRSSVVRGPSPATAGSG